MSIRVLPDEIAELLDDASPAEDAATDAQVTAFIAEHQQNTRPNVLQGLVSALGKRFAAGESRHQIHGAGPGGRDERSPTRPLRGASRDRRHQTDVPRRGRQTPGIGENRAPPVTAPSPPRSSTAFWRGRSGRPSAPISTRSEPASTRRCPTTSNG